MAGAQETNPSPRCPGCGAQSWAIGKVFGGSVVMTIDPEADLEKEECTECGTVVYGVKAYLTIIR